MIALVLSYFNLKRGPSILITNPDSINEKTFHEVPKLLDIYDEGFSLQIFESYKSANLQFTIKSKYARGGVIMLLVSIITNRKFNLNANIAKEILIQIENEVKEIKDVDEAFQSEDDNEKNLRKIREVLNKHYKSILSTIKTLERAEIRYQSLFKSARDAIFLINKRSSKIIDVNQEGCELLGKTRDSLLGQKFDDILIIDNKSSLFDQIVEQSQSRQTNLISTFFIAQSGKRVGIEINTSTIQIGNEIVIQCIIRDISKRLEIEEKLRKSEEKYRLIFENASDLIKVLNANFQYEELNETVHERILGFSKDDLLFKSPIAHVHPDDRKQASILLSRILRKGKGSFQARFIHKNGSIKWLEISAKNFTDSAGNNKVITIGRDITDRKIAEQSLIESEERYRLITENAFDLITVIDEDLKYLFINESRYKEKLGYTNAELIGNSIIKFIHPDDVKQVVENREKGLKTGKAEGGIIRVKKKDGDWLWVENRSRIFHVENDKLRAVIISRDVSENMHKNQGQKF